PPHIDNLLAPISRGNGNGFATVTIARTGTFQVEWNGRETALARRGRRLPRHGNTGLARFTVSRAGNASTDKPPPSASISATLATRRLCRTDSAACWSDNSKVCSVITLV